MILKNFFLIIALLGLICISLFGGYLLGSENKKQSVFIEKPLSKSEKNITFFQKNLGSSDQARKEGLTLASPEKGKVKEIKKEDKNIPAKIKKETNVPQNKEEINKPENNKISVGGENSSDPEKNKKKKEALSDSSVENIDSATLRDKLARYYRTGTFHEDDLAKNYKKSNDSLRTYLLNKKDPYAAQQKMLRVWDSGDHNISNTKDWKKIKYTSLEKIHDSFEINEIKHKYHLNAQDKTSSYDHAMKKIIVNPWVSRVHY